ncbi:MAG: hypothetical protein IPP66_04585 [Anaerolineales bacterium]|nr:hypothetical protein [Anaerolineales bacterium]
MATSAMSEPNKMASQKRLRYILVASFALVLVLTFASYITTAVFWDGAFPSGEYHLQILNEAGDPVKGATLNIYQGKTLAFEYPFDNYLSENTLISNDEGEIVLTHLPRGLEFGGSGWDLFWIIPIRMGGPKFTCQIDAEGYKTYRFSSQQIFDTAYEAYNNDSVPRKTIQINGNEVKIMILEKMIMLEKR